MIEIYGGQLYQWDVGKTVEVTGSEATHLSLANQGDCMAVKQEIVGGKVEIPAYLLVSGKAIMAYAVKVTVAEVDGKRVEHRTTLESRCFAVKKRERPEDYVFEQDQRNFIYELITEAEEATEAARKVEQELREAWANGEFDGPAGDGKVKTVNGNGPDENGNVIVRSTCELEQPVWGKIVGDETETKELLRLSHDGRNGWAKPMSASEYSALMAKATSAMLHGGSEPVKDVPLRDIVHTSYDYDPTEGNVPCIILSDVGAYSGYSDCYLVIEGEEPVVLGYTQIPGEYTGMGDVAAALDHIIALQEAVIG